ncbi:MAG: putative DNA binding domain-containing protein [Lachnospiraceae bacterium]|nr:putative DNA binding domain-containing protein [Lachnospiraceae bacterium]
MNIEDLINGESKNVEYKEILPEISEKYIKTIVAFANTQGGKLIVGISDKSREVVGISPEDLFLTMDKIANAVADSCEPQIIPEIEPYTINGRTVIVVNIEPGAARPYYLKSKGKDKGTYIRSGATTRLADAYKIKELELEGSKVSWDELVCVGYKVTEKAIKKLCSDLNSYRKTFDKALPNITRINLINWKVLKKTGEDYFASNAFVLLTSEYFAFSKTQCAVFKGIDRNVFVDKREYTGPIYKQIEESINFVLRNIRLGAKIDGIFRKEDYELPVDAIREMIVNAHCHRNWTSESCVQVAIYDDRLEVTSPGGLYNGLTFEEALSGHSRLRNRVIANVFSQIRLVEAWGTGLRRIRNAAKQYGLGEPEFVEMPDMFRVSLYRKNVDLYNTSSVKEEIIIGETSEKTTINIGETSEKTIKNIGETSEKIKKVKLNSTQLKILELLQENPAMSACELANLIGISSRNIEVNIKKLKEKKLLERQGAARGGRWIVLADKEA